MCYCECRASARRRLQRSEPVAALASPLRVTAGTSRVRSLATHSVAAWYNNKPCAESTAAIGRQTRPHFSERATNSMTSTGRESNFGMHARFLHKRRAFLLLPLCFRLLTTPAARLASTRRHWNAAGRAGAAQCGASCAAAMLEAAVARLQRWPCCTSPRTIPYAFSNAAFRRLGWGHRCACGCGMRGTASLSGHRLRPPRCCRAYQSGAGLQHYRS